VQVKKEEMVVLPANHFSKVLWDFRT